MRRSELKNLGVDEDLIDDIMALHGKSKKRLETQNEALEEEVEGLKSDISNRDKQLEEIKNSSTDNKELQDKVVKYEAENERLKAENANIRLDAAIQLSVADKVHDPEDILRYVNRDELTLDGDVVKGLDEKVAELQKSKPYLFKPVDNNQPGNDDNTGNNEGEQQPDEDVQPPLPNPGVQSGNKGKEKDLSAAGREMYEKLYGKKEE